MLSSGYIYVLKLGTHRMSMHLGTEGQSKYDFIW